MPLNVGRTSNLPEPTFPDDTRLEPLYPGAAETRLARVFEGIEGMPTPWSAPGAWTAALRRLPPNAPMSPRQNLAFEDILRRLRPSPSMPSRELVELSISGQAASFAFNSSAFVRHNIQHQRYPSYLDLDFRTQLMQEAAGALALHGIIPKGCSLLECGAGLGYFSFALNGWCRQAKALDATRPPPEIMAAMPGLEFVESTIEDHAAAHPDERHDVLFAGHFSVNVDSAEQWQAAVESYFRAAARLVADKGRFIVGVSSINPLYLAAQSKENLVSLLEKFFGKVEQILACEFEEAYARRGSLGGMMGVLVATEPRQAQAA